MLKSFLSIILWISFQTHLSAQELFKMAEAKGTLDNHSINEASGLAASISQPNMLWTHNDSGDKARLFLINKKGKSLAEYRLKGAQNIDWEDISIGPGPDKGKSYIYVGDIGDNRRWRKIKTIYRVEEPQPTSKTVITNFDTINFTYPDGKYDAESLFVDPLSKDIYIFTKQNEKTGVYVARYPQSTTEVISLKKLNSIPFGKLVAADITANGQEILLKSYTKIYYWKRNKGSISDTLSAVPLSIKYHIEPQGEAIAWDKDGLGFYTLSEKFFKIDPVLYYYAKQ